MAHRSAKAEGSIPPPQQHSDYRAILTIVVVYIVVSQKMALTQQ